MYYDLIDNNITFQWGQHLFSTSELPSAAVGNLTKITLKKNLVERLLIFSTEKIELDLCVTMDNRNLFFITGKLATNQYLH